MAARKDGKQGHKADKLWSDAIRIAALEAAGKGKPKKLRAAATKLVSMAVEGDLAAMKEMGDRLEGKPTQAVDAMIDGKLVISWQK